eukprot:jgi/Ulvmu1/6483/UM003_0114.1
MADEAPAQVETPQVVEESGDAAVDGQNAGEDGGAEQTDMAEPAFVEPPACPILAKLYGESAFEPVELVAGVSLSRVVGAVWVDSGAEDFLKQNWKPEAPEDSEEPIAAFDPSSPEYTVLPKRLAKSKALQDVNRLKLGLKDVQEELSAIHGKKGMDEEREALQAKIDEATSALEEAQTAFSDLKASFQDDPQALTPWMNTLFDTADLGVTTFSACGSFWPRADLTTVFSASHGAERTTGAERVLATFRKRYILERGAAAAPRLIFRIAPNVMRAAVTAEVVSEAVVRVAEAAGVGPEAEAPEPLDAVEVCWWEGSGQSAVGALRQLGDMCREETETDEETGEVTVTAPRKIRALGVYGFSARAIEQAVAAGVSLAFAHFPYGFDVSADGRAALAACRRHGIRVIGGGACMHGLLDVSFLGLPAPQACGEPQRALELLTSTADAADAVAGVGGWSAFQKLLRAAADVAEKHGVTVQAVALRWVLDQDVVPVVPVSWSGAGRAFGKRGTGDTGTPDRLLFQRHSFLDEDDMQTLASALA